MSQQKTAIIDFTTFHNIIDGKPRDATNHTHAIDPTTGEKSWSIPIATEGDLNDAVKSGAKAFESWSQLSIDQRKEKIKAYFDLYAEYKQEFANLLAKESGKPVGYLDGPAW